MTSKEAFLALNLLPKIGPVRVRRLLSVFQSPEAILNARTERIAAVEGFSRQLAKRLVNWEDHVDLSGELARIREAGVSFLTIEDQEYPAELRRIYDPPIVLYLWGKLEEADGKALGVVGSRRASNYGIQAARRFSFQVAQSGVTVVSGLARGIDTAAHEGALAGKGRTLAIIGSGLGRLYPPENQALAEKISESGAVLTEFPILYPPDRQSFPMRNRIISGLSQGILVVEAPGKSGALITADQATEQGRNVYAIPGPIDRPTSLGANRLIQQGAKLVVGAEDILEDYGTLDLIFEESPNQEKESSKAENPRGLGLEEQAILRVLSSVEMGIEEIIEQSQLPVATVSTTLMKLEMMGHILQLPGKNFVKLV